MPRQMKKNRQGVTMIETSLFIALSAALVAGLMFGTSSIIKNQRFNDSAEDFAQFLRTAYNSVNNVSTQGSGNSNEAIYGKILFFNENKITVYTIAGDATMLTGDPLDALSAAKADFIKSNDNGEVKYYGEPTVYTVQWQDVIQSTDGGNPRPIIITTSPVSNIINTYELKTTAKLDEADFNTGFTLSNLWTKANNTANGGMIVANSINFCLKSDNSSKRRNVRIHANAHNSSAVEIVNLDDKDNECEKSN